MIHNPHQKKLQGYRGSFLIHRWATNFEQNRSQRVTVTFTVIEDKFVYKSHCGSYSYNSLSGVIGRQAYELQAFVRLSNTFKSNRIPA